MSDTHCGHGKPFYGDLADCVECDIVWHEEMLAAAENNVRHHENILAALIRRRDAHSTSTHA